MQRMRPRFQETLDYAPDEVLSRLRARQTQTDCPCQLKVLGQHVDVVLDEEVRHTWSPQLSLEVEPLEAGSQLHGHFGPNPSIWTTFLAAYAFVGLCMFFGGLLGMSQLVAGQSAWGFLSLPVGGIGLVAIYCASLWGQHLAASQMEALVTFLHSALAIDTRKPAKA